MEFNIFSWNFAHVSYLPMSKKGCSGFFWFYLDLELFTKIKKDLVSTHSIFYIFINNSGSRENKKNPEHVFVDIVK